MTEKELIHKLEKIERLISGATTDGERDAASHALDRVRERLKALEQNEPAVEYRFTLTDMWSRKLLVALFRRYGIEPYRYRRQRYTTVMARVPKSFLDTTLWPEFEQLSEVEKRKISTLVREL